MELPSKALVVAFGGLELGNRGPPKTGGIPGSGEDEDVNDIDGFVGKDKAAFSSEIREKLVKKLNSLHDVVVEGDLFADESESVVALGAGFAPVIISLRLPYTLQKISRRYQFRPGQKVENFRIIFDGRLVIYAAEVDPKQRFFSWVFADVRDRFVELVGRENAPKMIAPNVTSSIFLSNMKKGTAFEDMFFLQIPENMGWKSQLQWLYVSFRTDLHFLFEGTKLRERAMILGSKIESKQSELFKSLSKLLETHWYRFRTRSSLLAKLRREEVETLRLLSQYLDIKQRTNYIIRMIRLAMSQDEDVKGFMTSQLWEEDVQEEGPIQVENITQTIEHVRSESQALLGSTNTYVAALIGAAAGGIVTLVLTQIPTLLSLVK